MEDQQYGKGIKQEGKRSRRKEQGIERLENKKEAVMAQPETALLSVT